MVSRNVLLVGKEYIGAGYVTVMVRGGLPVRSSRYGCGGAQRAAWAS
jgi:hypothetical protein